MHKILSYLLLCCGILIILFALNSMYKVFITGGTVPVLVSFADLQLKTQYGLMSLPMAPVNTLANLMLFAVLMAFITTTGAKIAGIGCQLLKNERIYEALTALSKAPAEETIKKL